MKTEYIIVYIVLTLLIACAMELVDVVIKKIKAKIKANKVAKMEQEEE